MTTQIMMMLLGMSDEVELPPLFSIFLLYRELYFRWLLAARSGATQVGELFR